VDISTPNFLGRVSRYAAIPLIVALSPGHSDITKFRPWSPVATGNHFDRADKNSKKVLVLNIQMVRCTQHNTTSIGFDTVNF